jgi:SAM-dependent methyltransferase
MGLDIKAIRFLLGEKARGIQFGKTLTLGRQSLYMSQQELAEISNKINIELFTSSFADDFLAYLAGIPSLSMDASAYEGAQIIHDMNFPVEEKYHDSFDTIIDGGTLEHVFNFPMAIKNCMEMLKVGGSLIFMTPWHNFSGHGFYQFSPELFYSTLSDANGFQLERMLIAVEGYWYSVKNPSIVNERVEIKTDEEILLFVTARKTSISKIFENWPQQSDYCAAWKFETHDCLKETPISIYQNFLNYSILSKLRSWWRDYKKQRSRRPKNNKALKIVCSYKEIP